MCMCLSCLNLDITLAMSMYNELHWHGKGMWSRNSQFKGIKIIISSVNLEVVFSAIYHSIHCMLDVSCLLANSHWPLHTRI